MPNKTVRVGVIGAGTWGAMHVQAYCQHAGAEIIGICDVDACRAETVASRFGVPHAVTDVEDLLGLGLDGVSVATPDHAHVDPVLKAAAARVHVLVEKPLAQTVADCLTMIQAAESHDVFLMVDWHNRWNPPAHEAWRAVRNGELGEVIHIDYRWEISGTEGVLYFDATHNRSVAKYTAHTAGGFPDASYPDMFVTPVIHGRQMGFCVEPMYHFVDCITCGKRPLTSGADGLRNARILAAAEQSADKDSPVTLP